MSDQADIIEEIMGRYPGKPEYLIFLLQDVQADCGYISPEAMNLISEHACVPITQAYSVATFYQSFRLEPKGEHEVRVCLGTACHLKGGQRIVEELERKLNISAGDTTEDMMFTLNSVNCVGACALSPVILVDGKYETNITANKIEKILKQINNEHAGYSEGGTNV
ncbi:MAG: NAD(P)H-dependent oxidoreductase subunit E [Proteobacteria bacterium]|nr:NAD(P)H-dependent oxidoreductase subunit E [Pseudomonadota bacterium]